jgi:phenylacetate-CoA ligase
MCVSPQKGIIATAETLYDFMRDEIESAFRCPVYNRYGSREVGDIAGQCNERTGLHVFPWSVYVEIVGDDGMPVPAGTPGNVLVTSLANYAMPLIRYAIGDRATLAEDVSCPCGRKGQVLAEIQGRATDMFRCEDGTIVDYGGLIELLYFRPWVRRFQVVQHDYERFEFLVEPNGSLKPSAGELDEIRAGVGRATGANCSVQFTFVDRIQVSASGKYRFTISNVT